MPECLSRRPLETCESDVQINTRPVSHMPTASVDRKYRFPYMASCRLPYMGILWWGAGYFRCASYFRVVRVQPVALGSLQFDRLQNKFFFQLPLRRIYKQVPRTRMKQAICLVRKCSNAKFWLYQREKKNSIGWLNARIHESLRLQIK